MQRRQKILSHVCALSAATASCASRTKVVHGRSSCMHDSISRSRQRTHHSSPPGHAAGRTQYPFIPIEFSLGSAIMQVRWTIRYITQSIKKRPDPGLALTPGPSFLLVFSQISIAQSGRAVASELWSPGRRVIHAQAQLEG